MINENMNISPYRVAKRERRCIYASENTISKMFDISRTTTWRKVKAMREHPKFGKDVIKDGRFVRVKIKSFERFLKNVDR